MLKYVQKTISTIFYTLSERKPDVFILLYSLGSDFYLYPEFTLLQTIACVHVLPPQQHRRTQTHTHAATQLIRSGSKICFRSSEGRETPEPF